MSDTARDYQSTNAATTDGMEDLSDVVPTSADRSMADADIVATVNDSGSWVAVVDAASSLRKSERTIQRYAKCGKLRSKTDEFGRLLIWVPTIADSKINLETSANNQHLWNLLKEKDAKIEALLMRNGYLQAQMESSQETIKLLTDSQHKPGWWAKFSSWFFKGQ